MITREQARELLDALTVFRHTDEDAKVNGMDEHNIERFLDWVFSIPRSNLETGD